MSFFLILTVALMVGAAVLVVKRRSQRGPSRSGRYRSPRAGLNLERPARLPNRSRRKAASGSSSMAGPVFLALVVVVMVFWVVAAFFLPEGETRAAMVSETRADAAPPEQFSSLAGRLSSEPAAAAGQGVMARAAVNASGPPLPLESSPTGTGGSLMIAAKSLAPAADSRLEQVGLLPGRAATRSTAKKPAPANSEKQVRSAPANPARANRNANASGAGNTVPASGQSTPIIPVAPSPPTAAGTAVARSSVVAAASASSIPRSSVSGSSSQRQAPDEAALASSREFTVHLASFTDQGNAEQYKSKLNKAGEPAFITQAKIDGRMWFRVMSGSFNTRAAAEAHGKDLKRRSLTAETGRYMIKPLD